MSTLTPVRMNKANNVVNSRYTPNQQSNIPNTGNAVNGNAFERSRYSNVT